MTIESDRMEIKKIHKRQKNLMSYCGDCEWLLSRLSVALDVVEAAKSVIKWSDSLDEPFPAVLGDLDISVRRFEEEKP